jgi:perosamine synthetase
MDELMSIGEQYGIPVIEDAAEAIGSVYHGKRAGSIGKFGAFSFHGTKTLTTGEGGMFVTNDEELYEKVLILSNHGRGRGQIKQFWPDAVGFKYKMSNIQAAIGCAQVERLDDLIAGKRRVFKYYEERLGKLPLNMNPESGENINGYWMPTIVANRGVRFERTELLSFFIEDRIDGRIFFWPLTMLPMFEDKPGNKISYDLYKRAVNLPSYHELSDSDMDRVIQHVHNCF